MASTRRSARQSGPRAKYTGDAFEVAGLDQDSDVEVSSKAKGKQRAINVEDLSDSDEEFVAADDGEEGQASADEDEDGDGDDVSEYADQQEEDNDAMDVDEDEPEYEDKDHASNINRKPTNTGLSSGLVTMTRDEFHSRGILTPIIHTSKSLQARMNYGTDERDMLAILYARECWSSGLDMTFPTRRALDAVPLLPGYQYGSTLGIAPEEAERERTRGWDWYYDADIGGRFRKKQRLEKVKEDEARRTYMPLSTGNHTVLAGPFGGQKAYELGLNQAFDFGEAWGETKAQKKGKGSSKQKETTSTERVREGWILNVGQKIQAMGWAPNNSGLTQYLAISVPITKEQKQNYPDPLEDKMSSTFRSSAPYPAALQVWEFKAKEADSLTKSIDMNFEPRLRLALCTDWGDLRRIAWCPMPRDARKEDDRGAMKSIGLLASVWTDGCVRVIDVQITRKSDDAEYYKVQSPVFAAKPPLTVCTSVAWLSPSDIAVGCANGFVAVWTIEPTQPSTAEPLPYFYQPVHTTYIMDLSSAYPAYPHMLATTAMDGEARLFSILGFPTDVAETLRMRVASSNMTYSPILQCFVSIEDNDYVRMYTIRRFFATSMFAKLPSTPTVVAPASVCHPTVMLGCTAGTVVVTNPLTRLITTKSKPCQMKWFNHEWVPGKDTNSTGVSRFVDGFKAEYLNLARNVMSDRQRINGQMTVTIHEEGTHVTSLAWNLNQPCAGWASAGMGCGLIRVEDVALS